VAGGTVEVLKTGNPEENEVELLVVAFVAVVAVGVEEMGLRSKRWESSTRKVGGRVFIGGGGGPRPCGLDYVIF
jgi:hypothetical protein